MPPIDLSGLRDVSDEERDRRRQNRKRRRRLHFLGADWTPLQLGSSLLAWWDASQPSTVIRSGSLVSSWRDVVAGYAAEQTVDASKPTYDETLYGGAGALVFNGTSSVLTYEAQPLPSGATPSEVWVVADQQALIGDASSRTVFSYGGNSSAAARNLRRVVSGGVSLVAAITGTGGGASTAVGPNTTQWLGRAVARGTFGAAFVTAYKDGIAGTPVAAVPSTGTTRVVIGAATTDVPAAFWNGTISDALVTTALSAEQAAMLHSYLSRPLG